MEILTAKQTVAKIRLLVGKDLRGMAEEYGVTVFKDGKLNKGWAGHTIERHLGLGLSSKQAPNGEFWELKVVPLREKGGKYSPKETMAITMINAKHVVQKDFEESHLYAKLKSLVICGRLFESTEEKRSILVSAGTFELVDKGILHQVKEDYELVRHALKIKGFRELTGKMGVLVQPRTKGTGHGSTTRAFYARTAFVAKILNL